jgi:glycoprotein endo-alpha-1,2-mannosidase
MKKCVLTLAALAFMLVACMPPTANPDNGPTSTQPVTQPATATPDPGAGLPPVTGPDPSLRVGAFYYPWYANPAVDGEWFHWDYRDLPLPDSISSDYYPVLGPYSSNDPAVLAQHMAWLREAGIGVIISSWWGRGDFTDQAVPLLLDAADHYGIKVAFHIEIYDGRTEDSLIDDIDYIYANYGDHPAFFRTTAPSLYVPDDRPKAVFFLWAASSSDSHNPVAPSYWQAAMDSIHARPEGTIVLATTGGNMVEEGHFDGVYNYITLDVNSDSFTWARSLPTGAWYVPSVAPGNSAHRIGYPEETYVPRLEGATYQTQWAAALGTGVEPQMVTITSFNEWHEGSQIEPAASGKDDGRGYTYASYAPLPANGYLTQTRGLIDDFDAIDWSQTTTPIQIRITTSSDWTNVTLDSGGILIRPATLTKSEGATAGLDDNSLSLNQPIQQASAGREVEFALDVQLFNMEWNTPLVFLIARGHIGKTVVELYKYDGLTPILIQTFTWAGINSNAGNVQTFELPASELMDQP